MSNGRKFTKEFKLEVVKLFKDTRKPIARIARDLDIASSVLGLLLPITLRSYYVKHNHALSKIFIASP
ncbi:transposase [Wolbachia endosymbiont of Folsomia candida]|uniref:transposase n=1 Tax=Wolbachia endosymbiont of Folsomia candida TaxID=169402 RepID=UPI000D78A834|nr:hypothetical protein ASM33_08475 [Wolbachia endosymbiont of Folsomia candida]